LRDLVGQGAPIDGYGVGTRMNTSADWPYLDCVYKLQEYDGQPRRKRSPDKATWPGRKQVWRRSDAQGRFAGDTLGLITDQVEGEPLLVPVMRSGRRVEVAEALAVARERARRQLAGLPDTLRGLDEQPDYEVEVTAAVRELAAEVDRVT